MQHYDVAIVGAGPAGSSAAYFLKDSGLSVAVIERLSSERYERYHNICAAGISSKIDKILRIDDEFISNRFDTVSLVLPDGNRVDVKAKGYIIDRPRFFHNLLETSGATIVKGSVTDIREGYELTLSDGSGMTCDHLIGADGVFSVVRKRLFGSEPKKVAAATEFIIGDKPSDRLEISIDERYHGAYSWRFPRGINTCTGGMAGTYDEKISISKGSRYIPIGGVGRIVSGRAYLVGDSAAMANPVSFGGLSAAIRSARKAVGSIIRDDPDSYQRWWDGSRMSDRRFMEFHQKVSVMGNDELISMGKAFRHGNIYLDGAIACLTHPSRINLYFACLFAFKDGW